MLEASIKTSTAPTTSTTTSVVAIATASWPSRPTLAVTTIPATIALSVTLGCEESIDSLHAGPEVLELVEEQAEGGVDNLILLSLTGCNFSDLEMTEYQ